MSPTEDHELMKRQFVEFLREVPKLEIFKLLCQEICTIHTITHQSVMHRILSAMINSNLICISIPFKIMDKEKEDRISSLPDCLLLEIISRLELSTKEVIKTTSTISKRWQHLWTQLPTLLFIDKDDVTNLRHDTDLTDYFSFIDKTLTQCPTNVNLDKFQLTTTFNSEVYNRPTLQVNRWIRHAITRNVQEVDFRIVRNYKYASLTLDDELLFNNSCLMSMKLSSCAFNPPNGAICWDKLKFLCLDYGILDGNLIGKILSGSPCLETLELDCCCIVGRFSKSLFGNFGVERLSCPRKTYEWFTYGDEFFLGKDDDDDDDDEYYPDNLGLMSMKLSRCVSNPPNGWDNLNFLCIDVGELIYEDLIGKILTGSPCLETLKLNSCFGVRRFDIAAKSVKNLVLSSFGGIYTNTIEINAPYILSLTIERTLFLEKILLLNVSLLVKADLNFWVPDNFAERVERDRGDIEEELLRGLLSSLGHVNEVAFGDRSCLQILSRLKKRGFQFPKSSDVTSGGRYSLQPRFFLLIIILFFVFWVTLVSKPCGRLVHGV